MSIFTGVIAGWLGRRALELGGLLGAIATGYLALPASQQDAIQRILTGQWQDITLGALVPLAVYVFSQVLSFRATVKDQVVVDGQRVDPAKDLPASKGVLVEEIARTAVEHKKRRPSILERLFGRSR